MSYLEDWSIVIPFPSEKSAREALTMISAELNFMGWIQRDPGDDPPEYDPDTAESVRIGEIFDQGAAEHARYSQET